MTYEQATGRLYDDHGILIAVGYSGHGDGRNNPSMQSVKAVGPLPCGWYTVAGPPYDTITHGPYVLRLVPDASNVMYGRAGFLMHGDSKAAPGTASEGCIVMSRAVRQVVWTGQDHRVRVVPGTVANSVTMESMGES